MTDDDLEKLRQEESHGNRLDRDDPSAQPDFVDALDEALEAVENGETGDTITAYDPTLAAVLRALEEDDRLDDVFEQLQEAYDGNSGLDSASRSAIIRLAVRVGLQEGTADVMDDLREAINRRQSPTV
ncbi:MULTISPECIES: hypothetical protein [unclassified Halobellus]|uniref:hypothetical protein n=1 Tax=unclassified Halobellus TaxID=2638438 RepID=UPI000EF224E0|nr:MULTISPECIES: hypothetical protein [unclassified Halobellus]MDQ2055520.1 hypothetical protein [Halobellus sp. H-GB7]RLM83872.1 hypothetical protein D3D02_16390 [Halobellus sp. Atlit-38R]